MKLKLIILLLVSLGYCFGQKASRILVISSTDTLIYYRDSTWSEWKNKTDTVYYDIIVYQDSGSHITKCDKGINVFSGKGCKLIAGFYDTIYYDKWYIWTVDYSFDKFLDEYKKEIGMYFITKEWRDSTGALTSTMGHQYFYREYNRKSPPNKYLRQESIYENRNNLTIHDYVIWKRNQKPSYKEISEKNILIMQRKK